MGPGGANGQTGAEGATGARGSQGSTGAQGPQGIPGTKGTNGTNGTNGTLSSAYLDAYTTASQVVANGAAVAFPTQTETPVGAAANGANTIFTATSAGTYLISVRLANTPGVFQTQLNGVAVGPNDSVPGASESVTWTRPINVTARGTIAINNVNGNPEGVDVGSEITIIRIA